MNESMLNTTKQSLINATNISKFFLSAEKTEFKVLNNINFQINNGEIVALLGKSGSGKSTFLRILAGLIPPSAGSLTYYGKPIISPQAGIAMVFQSFALLPWLTVLQNVELGLEAQGIKRHIRRQRALHAIDTIGLDGFESAYPKELSGGMRQRVGFARALVVEPELLLMDEPFSALDILTAENLRNDLLDIWQSKQTRIKGILCVTHDIEEAILLANRIIIFSSDPGQILSEINVNLPYPRSTEHQEFQQLVDKIYLAMTTSERQRAAAKVPVIPISSTTTLPASTSTEYAYRIPEVDISELNGLLETMLSHELNGKIDLPDLADSLHLDVNNLFPLTEVLDMLRFAKISHGELCFTEAGMTYAKADLLARKQLFASHLLDNIPLAKHVRDYLDKSINNRVHESIFLDELISFFSPEEAERILKTIIDWGRYAEIFAYDYDSGELSLENPQ